MKIVIVRHAEPDYEHDSLTEKGFREAEFLADRLEKLQNIRAFHVSSMGRAKATAAPTLKRLGMEATYHDWLREFDHLIKRPDKHGEDAIPWDWVPEDWTSYPDFFSKDAWWSHPLFEEGHIKEYYDEVVEAFDQVLSENGYTRNGLLYDVTEANNDTLVFVCHFGLSVVLISHLMNVSPMVIWHGYAGVPSSVSTFISEERRRGRASFRANGLGDISHLYANDEPMGDNVRFCECLDNDWQRADD